MHLCRKIEERRLKSIGAMTMIFWGKILAPGLCQFHVGPYKSEWVYVVLPPVCAQNSRTCVILHIVIVRSPSLQTPPEREQLQRKGKQLWDNRYLGAAAAAAALFPSCSGWVSERPCTSLDLVTFLLRSRDLVKILWAIEISWSSILLRHQWQHPRTSKEAANRASLWSSRVFDYAHLWIS